MKLTTHPGWLHLLVLTGSGTDLLPPPIWLSLRFVENIANISVFYVCALDEFLSNNFELGNFFLLYLCSENYYKHFSPKVGK